MRFNAFITAALTSLLLGGCAGGGAPPATFDLLAPKVMTLTAPKPATFQLVVNEPRAVRSLESDRILVKPGPAQISYYKNAVWSDRLPRLLQARFVEAFQNAGLVSAVGSRADRLDADIEMATEVRAFQIDIDGGQAQAHASLYVKVIDGKNGRMIASRGFESQTPTSATDVNQMVVALNQSFDKILHDVVPWVAARRR
ncbi:MAG: ABC-type transport auxiliary lipoprotein family protein [Hyphomicrobiales bacterium]|nr:ABC-type transport auxiliary lipoprotein family protein [Hyphomicrobiales bacterium]